MDPKEIIEQSRQQRQQKAVEQVRVAAAKKGATFAAGQDNNTGQPLTRAIGGAAVPMRSLSNVQAEVGQQGRSDGRGFDVGSRRSRPSGRRVMPSDTIGQVYFLIDNSEIVAYYVGDRTRPKEVDRASASGLSSASAQVRFDSKSRPDITLIYFYADTRRLVWISQRTFFQATISRSELVFARNLAYGVFGPVGPVFTVDTRRLTRSRVTAAPIVPPTYRLEPYIFGAESQALPVDAIAALPAVNSTAVRPDVAFSITSDTALNSPPAGAPPSFINYSFTSDFTGVQQLKLLSLGVSGLNSVSGSIQYAGSFRTIEFYRSGGIQPSAPSNINPAFTFGSATMTNFPVAPSVLISSSNFAFASTIIDQDKLQGAGVSPDVWHNRGYLNGPGYFLGDRYSSPVQAPQVALCAVDGANLTVTPLNFGPTHPNYNTLRGFPNFYSDRTLYFYTQQLDQSWQELQAVIAGNGDLTINTRTVTLPDFSAEVPNLALYKSAMAVNLRAVNPGRFV
jgi:hypothetical protein